MTEQEIKANAPKGATHYYDYPHTGFDIDYYKIEDGLACVWAGWLDKPVWVIISNQIYLHDIKPLN